MPGRYVPVAGIVAAFFKGKEAKSRFQFLHLSPPLFFSGGKKEDIWEVPLLPSPQNISGGDICCRSQPRVSPREKKEGENSKIRDWEGARILFFGEKRRSFCRSGYGKQIWEYLYFSPGGEPFSTYSRQYLPKKFLFCCPRPHVLVVKGKKGYVIWPKKVFLLPAGGKKEEGLDIWEKLLCVFDVMLQPAGQKKAKKIGEM